MATPVSGDFFTVADNGVDFAAQIDNLTYTHELASNPIMPNNVGVHQFSPGIFKPKLSLSGLVKRGQGVQSASNLMDRVGAGASQDLEHIILAAIGTNAAPVAGDYCIAFDGTLLPEYQRQNDMQTFQRIQAQFQPRGVRVPLFPVLLLDVSQVGSLTTTFYDDGAESVGTLNGAASILEVLTPTGTAATGSVGATVNPADADTYTLVINGVTYTRRWKNAIALAGDVLIGGTLAASLNNLWQSFINSPIGRGTNFFTGTTPLDATVVTVSLPTATTVPLTAVNTGIAANSWTLAKTGVNTTVSGATFAGGVAGETATSIVVQTATSSGGAYTTKATHTLDMTRRAAEIIQVPVGTTLDRFIKVIITMSASTMTWAARLSFGRWFTGQR